MPGPGRAATKSFGIIRSVRTYQQPGTVLTDHHFSVPLDHGKPDGDRIEVFGREVVAVGKAGDERLPWLVFLQGGPGFPAQRPTGRSTWLDRALDDYRVLLLDQRGTGRSTPLTARSLAAFGSPAAQAEYLARFRADSIVLDCELIRRDLCGPDEQWTVLGQSFGGFAAVTYLSFAPHGIRDALLTGGLPGLETHAEDVYRQLYNPDLYLRAYGRIYRNDGAMTHGVTAETVDGMSLEKIQDIIDSLKAERYRWTPVRRVYIDKKGSPGKRRPLGLPTWSDKLLQEVIRSLLEAYYEPQFSDHSHGFRPGKGCHTALAEVSESWRGTTWFIEGDISQCFDRLDHAMLRSVLAEDIRDNRFLRLIDGLLQAGYLEEWRYHATLSGAPQGGVLTLPTQWATSSSMSR